MPHRPTSTGRPPWRVTVLTLFPEMFPGPLGVSLCGQALTAGLWTLRAIPIREFGLGRHRQVDDTPAGGGAGMVLRADVLAAVIDHARIAEPDAPLLYLSPRGVPLRQPYVHTLAEGPGAMFLAGRFEGIDERLIAGRNLQEVSIGDYVLAGGELAAMVVIEAAVRLLPGAVGTEDSVRHESFEIGGLEHPHYTRPRDWEGQSIPDVLLSGNHGEIAVWRAAEAHRITRERRPDLLVPPPPVSSPRARHET